VVADESRLVGTGWAGLFTILKYWYISCMYKHYLDMYLGEKDLSSPH